MVPVTIELAKAFEEAIFLLVRAFRLEFGHVHAIHYQDVLPRPGCYS